MFKVKNLVSKKREVLIFVWLAALTIFLVVRAIIYQGKKVLII
jgi:hypothetical protein